MLIWSVELEWDELYCLSFSTVRNLAVGSFDLSFDLSEVQKRPFLVTSKLSTFQAVTFLLRIYHFWPWLPTFFSFNEKVVTRYGPTGPEKFQNNVRTDQKGCKTRSKVLKFETNANYNYIKLTTKILFDSFSLSAMCFSLIKNLLDYVYSKSGCLLEKIAEKFSEFYLRKLFRSIFRASLKNQPNCG